MSVSAESVRLDAERMWVGLSDGRVIGVPMALVSRLLHAGSAARSEVGIGSLGRHFGKRQCQQVELFEGMGGRHSPGISTPRIVKKT